MNELVAIENLNPLTVFSDGGLDPVIDRIEKEAKSVVLDISTERGRKDIASLAYKIAQSKTTLDKMGKELVSGWKEQSKKVDAERARVWDRLENLQKEIRKPLTDWEDAEKARVAKHEANISEIVEGGRTTAENWQTFSLEVMRDRLKEIETDSYDWQEFANRAEFARTEAIAKIKDAIARREKHEADQAELERHRQEEAARKQREHEERIAAEAAAKAKVEAEAKAEQERLAIQREKEAAEQRALKAEAEKKAAEEKAKTDAEAAVKREQERAEAQRKQEADAAAKREADKTHRTKINREALAALVENGLVEDAAKKAVEAIARGAVPHVKISY